MSIIRYASFAEEPTYGVDDPVPSPSFYIDIASATLDVPTDPQVIPPSSLGRESQRHIPGFYTPSGNIVYAADIRTIGHFLKWTLGGYKFTEGAGEDPNVHEFWGSEQTILDSFVARLGKDLFEHVFHGCVVSNLSIAVEDDFTQATIETNAQKDTRANIKTLSAVEAEIPAEYPIAFHQVTAIKNSTGISPIVRTFTITIENGTSVDSGRTIGTRYPRRIPHFERVVTVTSTLSFTSIAELQEFWGHADGVSDSGSTEFSLQYVFDSGDNGNMNIYLPRSIYTSVPTQTSGRDEVTQNVGIRAFRTTHTLADSETEVESSILVELQNHQETLILPS